MNTVTQKGKFLTAEWRKLIIANYPIDPEILMPFVPKGTELDFFEDVCYVSLVGFMFLNTKLLGIRIPFHQNFEEFNLRFYVKRKMPDGWRRGVVFIKEIVPKPAIASIANWVYHEPYVSMPMKNEIIYSEGNLNVGYYFQYKNFWNKFTVKAKDTPISFHSGLVEDFITEHYWGYNKYSEHITMEYEVEHPSWKVYPVLDFNIHMRFKELYGEPFASVLQSRPLSILMAEGSEILVRSGSKLVF
ncbi:MAG TPA: DUF2071 domain-containing protein [Cytophagaceae bacterium]|nr:DUF2071 domain-containing protein [Cytophagaceae bacterium]